MNFNETTRDRRADLARLQSEVRREKAAHQEEVGKEQRERIIEEGRAYEDMIQTPGWGVLYSWLLAKVETSNFLGIPQEDLYPMQQRVVAYREVLMEVLTKIDQKNRYLEKESRQDERRKDAQAEES